MQLNDVPFGTFLFLACPHINHQNKIAGKIQAFCCNQKCMIVYVHHSKNILFAGKHNRFILAWYISNLIKIRSLTCSPWLICRGVGVLKKAHDGSDASDPYISVNENGDCGNMKVLLNCFACHKQSDRPKIL